MEEELRGEFGSDWRRLLDQLCWKLSGVVVAYVIWRAAEIIQHQTCLYLAALAIAGFLFGRFGWEAVCIVLFDLPTKITIDVNRITASRPWDKVTYLWKDVDLIISESKQTLFIARSDRRAIRLELGNYRISDGERIMEMILEIASSHRIPIKKLGL